MVFEEALALVANGICDYDDIDKAVTLGPGLRWAIQGPILHRHLGGGKGGVRHMIDHFGWDGEPGGENQFIEAINSRWGHATIDELEDEIRERQNSDFLEGRAVHFFNEVTAILEYVPDGFELDLADEDEAETEEYDDFPDLPEEEEGKIEEDETMKWDEEETRESEDLGDRNVKDEKSDNSAGGLPQKNTGRRGRSRKK